MAAFRPFDVTAPHLMYTILGTFTVLFGMFSLFVKEKLYLGEAPIATVVGIILGPYVLNLFDPYKWGGGNQGTTDLVTLELTRVVIAIGVFAVGVELPKAYMKRHWRTMAFLLGPAMVYGWLVSAALIYALIPGLTYLSCLVIAACVTPTDPILAQAVVGGKFANKHVPAHIRHLLSAESGCNDGAAFPFLYIALYLTLDKSPGHAVGEWFYMTWLYEVALGIVLGTVLGWSVRKLMQFSERKKLIDRQSFVAQYVSLAVLSIGICTLLGSDDLLAAFACGTAFAWDGHFNKATEDSLFSNVIDLLFNCAAFIYIGALIPFKAFADASINLAVWRLVVLAILILLIRRLPAILTLYRWIPDIKTIREAVFVGWFGPMGVGAIFIATLARHHIPHPEEDGDTSQVDLLQETIVPIVCMLVLASVLTHGLSIPFLVSGRRVHSITYTWSRNPSMDTRSGNEPAWTTHTRRVQPGQQVQINRDDEEGDMGLMNHREKSIAIDDGSGSNSSDTRTDDKPITGILQEPQTPATPPLARYKEGEDLVIERRNANNGVDVQVVRGAFSPQDGQHITIDGHELDAHGHVIRSHSRTANIHSLSDHLPHIHGHHGHHEHHAHPTRHSPPPPPNNDEDSDNDHSTNAGSDDEDVGDGFVRRRPYAYSGRTPSYGSQPPVQTETASPTGSGPAIHSFIPASRIGKPDKKVDRKSEKEAGGWRRYLRVATTSSNSSSQAEEGRAGEGSSNFLRVPTAASMRAPTKDASDEPGIPLERTISFHPNVADSSDTAPSMQNYGSAAPGFKKTPGLSMFRTTSIKADGDNDEQ